jgi:hypothetical protein
MADSSLALLHHIPDAAMPVRGEACHSLKPCGPGALLRRPSWPACPAPPRLHLSRSVDFGAGSPEASVDVTGGLWW